MDFDPANSPGLGMKIILSLVKQIGGTFQILPVENGRGARFTVTFCSGIGRVPAPQTVRSNALAGNTSRGSPRLVCERKKCAVSDPAVTFLLILVVGIAVGILFDRVAGPSWLTPNYPINPRHRPSKRTGGHSRARSSVITSLG